MGKKATRPVYRNRVDYTSLLSELRHETAAGRQKTEEKTETAAWEDAPGPSLFRQRILSNEQVKYVYAAGENRIHDKSCKEARQIPDDELLYTEEYLPQLRQCPECAVKAYVRIGAEDMENYNTYLKLFEKMQVSEKLIRHIYAECGMKTKASVNVLTIWNREDAWKIVSLDAGGSVQLLHNNYHLTKEGGRQFGFGYHVQNEYTQRTDVEFAIKIIETYSFDAHRAAAAAKLMEQEMSRPNMQQEEADGEIREQEASGWEMTEQETSDWEIMEQETLGWKTSGRQETSVRKMSGRQETPDWEISVQPEADVHAAGLNRAHRGILHRLMACLRNLKKWLRRQQKRLKPYAVKITGFHQVSDSGLPADGTICIYVWKNKYGEYCWRCGQYQARSGQFIVQYGDVKYITNEKKVVAWKQLAENESSPARAERANEKKTIA